MGPDTAEIDHLLELLSPLGRITARRMFGGWGVYADGPGSGRVIVAIVIDHQLLLKTDEDTRPTFERAGCAPFMYRARNREVPMSYWSVPDEALDSPDAMRPWARLAMEAALRKPDKPKRRGRRT